MNIVRNNDYICGLLLMIMKIVEKNIPFAILMLQLIAITLLYGACDDHDMTRTLDEADRIMEDNPDSALCLITSLQSGRGNYGRQEARRVLLETQARIKTDRSVESDSAIAKAAEFFIKKDPGSFDCMRALYYQSQVLKNNSDNSNILRLLLPSYKMAKELGDTLWIARTAEQLGFYYDQALNDSLSLMYSKISADSYKSAGYELNYLYAMTDQMVTLNKLNEYDRSIVLGDSLLPLLPDDSIHMNVRNYILRNKLEALDYSKQYEKADSCINMMVAMNAFSGNDPYQFLNSARVKIALGDYDKAFEYISKSMEYIQDQQCKVLFFNTLGLYYSGLGDYRSALAMNDSIAAIQTVDILGILRRSTSVIESDYYHQQALIEETNAKVWRNTLIVSAVAFILIATAFVYAYLQKIRRQNERFIMQKKSLDDALKQIGQLVETAVTLRNTITKKDEEINNIESRIDSKTDKEKEDLQSGIFSLFDMQCKVINKICSECISDDESPKALIIRNKNILSILEELRNPKLQNDIENLLNDSQSDIIKRLREQCKNLTEDDICVILLGYARFKPQTIAIILNVKLATVYKRRSRAQEKISESSAPDKSDFLALFKR